MLKKLSSYLDVQQVRLDEKTVNKYSYLPRFIYRYDFSPIPGLITSDSGWGCCFRSTQGLVARYFIELENNFPDYFYSNFPNMQILSLFEDTPTAPFSIHNLTKICSSFGLKPGSWAKPSQACAAVLEIFKKYKLNAISTIDQNIDPSKIDEFDNNPILFLVPLMLGLETIDEKFYPFIIDVFHRKEFIGIVSGDSAYSYYFVGITDDNNLIYFDPHVSKAAVLSSHDHPDFFSQPPKVMQLQSLNPSIMIGFYCESKEKLKELVNYLVSFKNSPITSHKIEESVLNDVLDIDDLDI